MATTPLSTMYYAEGRLLIGTWSKSYIIHMEILGIIWVFLHSHLWMCTDVDVRPGGGGWSFWRITPELHGKKRKNNNTGTNKENIRYAQRFNKERERKKTSETFNLFPTKHLAARSERYWATLGDNFLPLSSHFACSCLQVGVPHFSWVSRGRAKQ